MFPKHFLRARHFTGFISLVFTATPGGSLASCVLYLLVPPFYRKLRLKEVKLLPKVTCCCFCGKAQDTALYHSICSERVSAIGPRGLWVQSTRCPEG